MGIVRYNADGSLDAGFGHGGVVAERTVQGGLTPEALVIQANGKIVLAGTSSDLATAAVGFGLARYNPDGTLDSSFGAGRAVLTRVGAATAEAHAVALQPDGDLVVAGGASPRSPPRATSPWRATRRTGPWTRGFGSGGIVLTPIAGSGAAGRAIALQSDGRIVVAGTAFASGTTNDALALARYNADGSLDPTFREQRQRHHQLRFRGSDEPFRNAALVIQPDGKLVAVGSVGGHQGAFALARYLPSGDLDSAFGTVGRVTVGREASTQAYAAALQPDGNIVVGGGLGADVVAFGLARYGPNGDLDASFGSGGFVTTTFDGGGSGAHAVNGAIGWPDHCGRIRQRRFRGRSLFDQRNTGPQLWERWRSAHDGRRCGQHAGGADCPGGR